MICSILLILWAVLLVGLLIAFYKYARSKPNTLFLFKDFNKTDIPYINIDIQGQSLNMLVDTCCGISILKRGLIDKLEYEKSPRKISLQALTSDSLTSSTVSVPISIGNKKIVEDFALYDGEDIANFEVLYGITLHGILGAEFFEKTHCKIDYKKHCLIIP